MLQIQEIKKNKDFIIEQLKKKYFQAEEIISIIIDKEEIKKNKKIELESILNEVNSSSKNIGHLLSQGKKAEADTCKAKISEHKTKINSLNQEIKDLEQEIKNHLLVLPNVPSSFVPTGKTAADNEVIFSTLTDADISNQLNTVSNCHWDILKEFNLGDFEKGSLLSGSGFSLLIGAGAKLQRALIHFFLDFNTQEGYQEIAPPLLVNYETAFATGQLPDKEGQMYYIEQDQLYLIPTSEVPLTNIYRDTIINESDLPIKHTAVTSCFRREAGSFGKEVRGLNRVHQFEKVEIVQITQPENSYQVLDEMVEHVKQLLLKLGLPFRIIRLCGGDLSFASALTYDFEVYSFAQKRWLEVSSVSNFETFQTNRLKCRFKNRDGKTQLLHSLNGSALALPRIIACILENNLTAQGIKIPANLVPYFGQEFIVK